MNLPTPEECQKLENTTVKWFYPSTPEGQFTPDFIGLIIGCDPYVGLTIVDKENKTRKLTCLNGPSSPYKGYGNKDKYYEDNFLNSIKMIRNGEYRASESCKITGQPVGMEGKLECPFGD